MNAGEARVIRGTLGMSPERVEQLSGVGPQELARIERGEQPVPQRYADLLVEAWVRMLGDIRKIVLKVEEEEARAGAPVGEMDLDLYANMAGSAGQAGPDQLTRDELEHRVGVFFAVLNVRGIKTAIKTHTPEPAG